MVRLRRWFFEFVFDVLKSERIFWNRSVRSDLLGVEMRIGKRVCRSLHQNSVSLYSSLLQRQRDKRRRVNDVLPSQQH